MRVTVTLGAVLLACSASAAQTRCSAAVNELAPTALRADGPLQSICMPMTVDGRKLLVAAYSNGGGGHLAVVTDATPPVVVARSAEVLFDVAQSVELRDIDGDGKPEILATYLNRNDLLTWFFAFDPPGTLRSLSEPIGNARFVDVDGDGHIEVVSVSVEKAEDPDGLTVAHPSYVLYALRDGRLVETDRKVFHYSTHARTKTTPVAETVDVHVPLPGAYQVTLINGDAGAAPCTSGEVLINGKTAFAERDFKKALRTMTADVGLAADNLIQVKLTGAPGCSVALLVERH
jgi:hypothetical protein